MQFKDSNWGDPEPEVIPDSEDEDDRPLVPPRSRSKPRGLMAARAVARQSHPTPPSLPSQPAVKKANLPTQPFVGVPRVLQHKPILKTMPSTIATHGSVFGIATGPSPPQLPSTILVPRSPPKAQSSTNNPSSSFKDAITPPSLLQPQTAGMAQPSSTPIIQFTFKPDPLASHAPNPTATHATLLTKPSFATTVPPPPQLPAALTSQPLISFSQPTPTQAEICGNQETRNARHQTNLAYRQAILAQEAREQATKQKRFQDHEESIKQTKKQKMLETDMEMGYDHSPKGPGKLHNSAGISKKGMREELRRLKWQMGQMGLGREEGEVDWKPSSEGLGMTFMEKEAMRKKEAATLAETLGRPSAWTGNSGGAGVRGRKPSGFSARQNKNFREKKARMAREMGETNKGGKDKDFGDDEEEEEEEEAAKVKSMSGDANDELDRL